MPQGCIFVGIGFPFIDVRDFVSSPTFQLTVPRFPLASPEREFIRSFGPLETRLGGGVDEWAGEDVYGRAATAIRFPNRLERRNLGTGTVPYNVPFTFRRFYSDGRIARLEVGIRLNASKASKPLDPAACLTILQNCLNLDVKVLSSQRRTFTSCALINAGELLAEHYLRATTARTGGQLPPVEKWWFTAGSPVVLFHYRPASLLAALPPHARTVQISEGQDFTIANLRLLRDRKPVKVWLVGSDPGSSDTDRLRRLRIHLFRLHTEREGLKEVLRLIRAQELTLPPGSSDPIQEYLDTAITLLERPQRFGLDQAALVDSARYLHELIAPGEKTTILAQVKQARRNVVRKIERITEKSVESASVSYVINNYGSGDVNMNNKSITMGDVINTGNFTVTVADTIERSFNTAAQSQAPDPLKEELKKLATQVAELAKQLPPEKAEEAARDLEVLTKEAVSPQPRKKWYELSADGLVEAAKTVAEIAAPVATTVTTILNLLA